MNKILITGGCGFLGYYLINELKKELPEVKIKVLDLNENALDSFKIEGVEMALKKDITDLNSIEGEFKDIDTVIHCAGLVSFALKDKKTLFDVNVRGTKNVLEASSKNNVKNFVHISSVAALGFNDNKDVPVNEEFKFDWEIARSKEKYYMLTKYLADEEVKKYSNMDMLILYPGLLFGPGDVKNSAKLVNAIKNRRIPVNMPGGTNVIDVWDVAKGIVSLMKNKKKGDYLLSGHNLTFKEMNEKIASVVKVTSPSITLPKFLKTPLFHLVKLIEKLNKNTELPSDNVDSSFKFRYFDNSKAREAGWEPKISFEETIKNTYSWMVKDGITKE